MMTIPEVIMYFKKNNIIADPLAIERWIHQGELAAFRLKDRNGEWRIPKESLAPFVFAYLREENHELRQQNARLRKDEAELKRRRDDLLQQLNDMKGRYTE